MTALDVDRTPGGSAPGSDVLAERIWDLTGYATPTTSLTTNQRLHNDGITFVVPPSGWVRVIFSGACWSAGGVWWMLLNGNSSAVPRTQLTINSNNQPVNSTLEIAVNCTATDVALVPGQTVTWYWGWASTAAGQAVTFDNALSTMRVEALESPPVYPKGSDYIAGQTPVLRTIENVSSVGGTVATTTTDWAAQPEPGDLLLAVMMANVAPASWVLPSGWSAAVTQQVGTTARYVGVLWKVAGAAEPTALTWTATGATLIVVHPWSKRGFTGTPAVGLTAGQSQASAASTTLNTTGGTASAPQYGVAAIAAGNTVTVQRIGNGWDGASYADRGDIFVDDTTAATMGAAEKLLVELGRDALVNPLLATAQAFAVVLATFSGV